MAALLMSLHARFSVWSETRSVYGQGRSFGVMVCEHVHRWIGRRLERRVVTCLYERLAQTLRELQ